MIKLGDIVKSKHTNKIEGMVISTLGNYNIRLLYKDDVNQLNTKSSCYSTPLEDNLEIIDHLSIEDTINNYFYK